MGCNMETYPSEAGVRPKEQLVDDQAGEVDSLRASKSRNMVADANEDETDEEARQRREGPEAAAAGLHEEDGRDRAEEEATAADEGHVVGFELVEADLLHED